MITVLTGKNEFALQQKLQAIKSDWKNDNAQAPIEDYEAESIENPASFINELQTISLFSTKRLVVLRRASENKELLEFIEHYGKNIPDEISLIIYDPGLDLRTKPAKWLKQNSQWRELKPLNDIELQQWLKTVCQDSRVNLKPQLQAKLLNLVNYNQLRAWQEVKKLGLQTSEIDETLLEKLVPRTLDDNIFDLLDAICHKNTKKATLLLADFKQTKIDPHYIFNMLVWQFNVIALSLSGDKSPNEIARESGVSQGALARAKGLRSFIPPQRLAKILNILAEIDQKIRQSDAWTQIDRLLFV